MPQFGPGDESETVLLGCLVNEHLRLWRSDGRAECVRVLHPQALSSVLARGLVPRAALESTQFREVGRLDPAGVLFVNRRPFAVAVCDEPDASEGLWAAAADAIARGEYLLVERGGWQGESDRYVLARAQRTPDEWFLHVESVPPPHGPSWPEPADGHLGWGVAAPAEPETLAALGSLIGEAVSMWAQSPLDVAFTFAKQPDGAWPPVETPAAIENLLGDMRADIEELHSKRKLSRAVDLSKRSGTRFNHNTYPVFFYGDLGSRLVLVQANPQQAKNDAAKYVGDFEYADFDDYLERHRRFGFYRWELGHDVPSPFDYKQMRFLRHWGIVDLVDDESSDGQRTNVVRSVDQILQLELIPYGSPKLPADALPIDVLASHYGRLLRVITAYPRDYVILCGTVFDPLLELYVLQREDHRFRLPTSTGTSRVEYRFSNLLLDFDGGSVAVGLAPNFSSPGIPMDAYGEKCHELYRDLSQST